MVLDISDENVVTAVNKEDGLLKIQAKAIVLAMGCRERPRGALEISGTRASGIMTAGTAQKYVNIDGYMPGKKIVILGSGDIGLIMARRMTLEGAKVETVCELMPYSGGLQRNIVQCLEDMGIPLRLSCTVIKTHGIERLEGVTIANVDENRQPIPGTEEYIECDTLLLSVGLIPENELTRSAGIMLDPITNGAIVDEYRQTSRPGIFACGNVLQVHDLVDYVTEESQIAGKGAADYIFGKKKGGTFINTKGVNGVRYIVPQRVNIEGEENLKLYFRVGQVYKGAKVVVECDGKILSSKKKVKLAPGETIKVPTGIRVWIEDGWGLKNPDIPILIASGKEDPCHMGPRSFGKSVHHLKAVGYNNIKARLYGRMRHEILNEKDKIRVYKDIYNFIKE